MKIQGTYALDPTALKHIHAEPSSLADFFSQQRRFPVKKGSFSENGFQCAVHFGTSHTIIDFHTNAELWLLWFVCGISAMEQGNLSVKHGKIIPAFLKLCSKEEISGLIDALRLPKVFERISLAVSAAMLADSFEFHYIGGRSLHKWSYPEISYEVKPKLLDKGWNPFQWQGTFLATAEYFYARPDEMAKLLPLGPLIDFTGLLPPEGEVFKKWGRIIEASLLHRKNDHPDVVHVDWIWEHPAYIAAQETIRRQEREALLTDIAGKLEAATQERAQAKAQAMQRGQKPKQGRGQGQAAEGRSLAAMVQGLDTRLAVTEEGQKRERVFFEYWQKAAQGMPYLRPLMSEFMLSLDRSAAMRLGIARAAIDPHGRVLYLNKGNLSGWHLHYVYSLLLLKVALGHHERMQGKDPFLWDKASDILLTGWLEDMLPDMPDWVQRFPSLEALPSVEAIYLQLLEWRGREVRRLETLRGPASSILSEGELSAAEAADRDAALLGRVREGVELAQALEGANWGDFGAGLARALKARAAKAVPWKPAFAEYLTEITPTVQRERTYAKLSRRIRHREEPKAGRRRIRQGEAHNLLVIVDTSASMSDEDLQGALGAIRATAGALGITAIRLFACDAQVRDYGWEAPWHAGAGVVLHGGGGTNLDPALRLIAELTEAGELMPEQPLLIVTDGLFYGEIKTAREHAYLLPKGAALGYKTAAPVFHMTQEE